MPRVLPADLALALLTELSWDVAGAVLRTRGAEASVGTRPSGARTIAVRTRGGELVVVPGPHALDALVEHDAARVLALSAGRPEGAG